MLRSQLNSYSGNDPIWGFVAIVGTERFTGEAAVGLAPRIHLFAMEGRVYYAEREGDAPIGERLVNCAAISAAQLEHGSVRLGEVNSLARLFQRQPLVDRDAVELTIELATESLLESVANNPVGMPEVFPLRHHSSGIHHWLRSAAPTSPALVDRAADVPAEPQSAAVTPEPVLSPEPIVAVVVEPEPVAVEPEPAVEETAVVEPEPVAVVEPEPEPVAVVDPVAIFEPEPAVEEIAAIEPEPAPSAFVPLSLTPLSTPTPAPEAEAPAAVQPAEPTFEPLPMLGITAQSPPAAPPSPAPMPTAAPAPSFNDLDAVLGLGADYVPAPTPSAPALDDLPPISSLAFLSSIDAATDSQSAPLPHLADLPSLSAPAANAPDHLQVAPPERNPMEPGPAPVGLPKLATGPVSVDILNFDPAHMNDAARTGGAPTHTLAAVEIWELVDGIMVDAQPAASATSDGDDDDRRGRGWRRSKKS